MSHFNDIKDKDLQAYNRLVYLRALQEDCGEEQAKSYLGKIPKEEQQTMFSILKYLNDHNVPALKRKLTSNLELL